MCSVRCQLWSAQYEPSLAWHAVTSHASSTSTGVHEFAKVFQTGRCWEPQPPE